ncbi:hypothetical protein AaE_010180 [Aphanomyces astaci]|uniref:Uncharacterized protein n=1 Tax=Aphanomyces astaci TaxID=112090 RepID=A0A6A4ZVK7_APHAT|nr:hypothetical protein AaE_010180 [Aphanomyces astaci]
MARLVLQVNDASVVERDCAGLPNGLKHGRTPASLPPKASGGPGIASAHAAAVVHIVALPRARTSPIAIVSPCNTWSVALLTYKLTSLLGDATTRSLGLDWISKHLYHNLDPDFLERCRVPVTVDLFGGCAGRVQGARGTHAMIPACTLPT